MRKLWPLPPKGNHRKFRIMSQEDGRYAQVSDPRLASINALYTSRVIDGETAAAQVGQLVASLRKAAEPDRQPYSDANLDVFDSYFREEYESRDILPESLASAKASFKRALDLMGVLNIPTATQKEVQAKIYALPHAKRPHVVLALNALFKFAGREVRVEVGTRRGPIERVRYLSLSEFQKVEQHIAHPLVRTLAATAFATGARVGELFAIHRYNELKRVLTIDSQIDRLKQERQTKTYQQRTTVVVKELEAPVKNWLMTPIHERLTIRGFHLGRYVQQACIKAKVDKECHFYDLRHSYAIHLLSMGVSLSLVAQALGNTEEVCRRHYTGHVLSDDGTDLINRIQEGQK